MLWWQGLRSRALVDLLLAALAAVAVATAVLGPLLVRAVEQNSAADTIARAAGSDANASLSVQASGSFKQELAPLVFGAEAPLERVRSDHPELWEPVQQWTETTVNVAWRSGRSKDDGETYSRLRVADSCTGLTLTAGTCPGASGQALVSTSDAAKDGVTVGGTVLYRLAGIVGTLSMKVVGLYDPTRVETPLTRPGQEAYSASVTTGDPLVVGDAQIASLPLPTQVSARLVLARQVDLADLPFLRAAVSTLDAAVLDQDLTLVVDTRLRDALDRVASQSSAAVVLVGVVEAQALGLAAFAVVVVLTRISRSRGAEWGAGRLLGIPRRRWFRSMYVEAGSALLIGLVLGYAAAVGVGYVAVRTGLRPGTPFEPWRWPVLVAVAASGLALLLALVAVSLPSLRQPLAELVAERSEAGRLTPVTASAQAVVVLLAGFTVYVLLAGDVLGGRGPQVGLLAPALFAVALAVVSVRLAVLLVRRRSRRHARSLVGLVVARQAARTPSSLAPAVVVTVGVALVVFAGQVLALSVRNQELKADAVSGADTVLTVTAPRGTDLIAAVDEADPSGHQAMAVRERVPNGAAGPQRVVAVDTSRLGAVAAWSSSWAGVADVATALRPATTAPVELRGTRIVVSLDQVSVRPDEPLSDDVARADPQLVVTVDTGARWQTVALGTVAGRSRLAGAIPCRSGCRLVALGLRSGPQQPYSANVRITGIATDVQAARDSTAWLTDASGWHSRVGGYLDPDAPARAWPEPVAGGLKIAFSDDNGGATPGVAPSDVLDPLPVLLGPRTVVQPFAGIDGGAFGTGLDGASQLVEVVGKAQVLPRALDDGVLTDLRSAQDLVDPQADTSTAEVWLAPGASPSIETSLSKSGFVVIGRELRTDTATALLREPTTRGASVAQTVSLAAALLTLLTLVAARVADAARRRVDWRSIADAGVRGRMLRRLATVEIAVPALLSVLLGAASGVVAVLLSAGRLPVVDLATPGPPLALGLDWPLALATTLVSAVAVALVAVVGAAIETRGVALS